MMIVLVMSCSSLIMGASEYPYFKGLVKEGVEQADGWYLLQEATGDLNSDGLSDIVMILESQDSVRHVREPKGDISFSRKRILLVLLDDGTGHHVVVQNNHFLPRSDEGGMLTDLVPEVSIDSGVLQLSVNYVRSNTTYHFHYHRDRFELIWAKRAGVVSGSGLMIVTTFDFENMIITNEMGNVSDDELAVEKEKMKGVKVPRLANMGAMYSWEVVGDFHL